MRLILRLVAFLLLAPIAFVAVLILAAAAVAGIPLLWEKLIRTYTAPPQRPTDAG